MSGDVPADEIIEQASFPPCAGNSEGVLRKLGTIAKEHVSESRYL